MTGTQRSIERLWVRIQEHFLDHPRLTLTEAAIAQRFDGDDRIRRAVLDGLVESSVLQRTGTGRLRLASRTLDRGDRRAA